jgi:hypothetical protein
MRHKKLILSIVLLSGFGLTAIHAQKAILTDGNIALGTGGSMSYSIGQIVYTALIGVNGSVSQGVQQTYEISTGLSETEGISLNVSAYPNPTTDVLTLRVESFDYSNLTYAIYDIYGKLLENKKLAGNETSINMRDFFPATYFLKISDSNKELSTFKIIKY